jgi:tetratricopeptide (TPR) repeat protein
MASRSFLLLGLLAATSARAQSPAFTLQGRITVSRPAASIRVVLEDPKARNAEVANVSVGEDGEYRIDGLLKREYRLVTILEGKRQDRRDVDILCRPNAVVSKDFHYGKTPSTLMLQFPAEDPDTVDVAELRGDYSREVLRDYERAFQDHINGNVSRAVERLEAIAARAPNFYRAHARLGLIFQQEGCFADAESEYIRASELSLRSVQPLLNLASLQIRAADVPGQVETMIPRALETLKKAMEIRPGSALSYTLAGAARVKIRAFDEAEKDFQRALDLDPLLGAARLLLANLYLKQENWSAGIENLRAYMEDFPFAPDRPVVKQMIEEAIRHASDTPNNF